MIPTRQAWYRRRHRRLRPGALLLALSVSIGAVDARAAEESALAVRLVAGERTGELIVEIGNTGDEPLAVLRDGTPLEPVLSADVLDIRRGARRWPPLERPPYIGRLARRLPPGPDDFVTLSPGEWRSASLDIGRYYDVPDTGDYRVEYVGSLRVATAPAALAARRARLGEGLRVVRPATRGLEMTLAPDPGGLRARPPTFQSCDANQQRLLVEATTNAEVITAESLSSLENLPTGARAGSPRYTTWFGVHDEARYATVTEGYRAMLDSLSGETLNYDCACPDEDSRVIAYVYPFLLHDINLCPLFFRTDVFSDIERAGTVVHELSHFTALVGTDDHAYGASAVAGLARRSPALAIDNADNFTFFAQNDSPELPMAGEGVDTGAPGGPPDRTTPPPPDTGFVSLPIGSAVRGRLARNEFALYLAHGADTISLESTSGDADLYVFERPSLEEEALICSSATPSANAAIEICELTDADTHYVAVFGFEDAEFAVLATRSALPPPPDTGSLAPGGSAEGRLGADSFTVYTATAPARVTLESLDGDADLYVFADDSLSEEGLLCDSRRQAGLDVCALPDPRPLHIVVHSVGGSAFRLGVAALPGSPRPDDDPTPIASSGGSGGGGAGAWFGALLAALAFGRHRPATGGRRRP